MSQCSQLLFLFACFFLKKKTNTKKYNTYFPWRNWFSTLIPICMQLCSYSNYWAASCSYSCARPAVMCLLSWKLATLWPLLQNKALQSISFSFSFLFLPMKKRGTAITITDHMENMGCVTGSGGEERLRESFKSRLMEDGEESLWRPAGLLENCVQWWRGQWWERARSSATGDACGNSSVRCKTAVKHKSPQMCCWRENTNTQFGICDRIILCVWSVSH